MTDDLDEQARYYRSLPRKRMAAGLVCRDIAGRVLLVRPTYKPTWLVPGGVVEADESPADAVAREVREELGVELPIGRLLTVDWLPAAGPRTEGLMLLFDGGVISEATTATFQLPSEELSDWAFVEPDRFDAMLTPTLARRLRQSLLALATGASRYLENGSPRPPVAVSTHAGPVQSAAAAATGD